MRVLPFILMALTLPLAAMAQERANAPMIVDLSPKVEPVLNGAAPTAFPESAVTRIGENTTGMQSAAPDTPVNPSAPMAPIPSAPQTPPAPATPSSPTSKLWPRDTVPIFMRACTGYHPELVPACRCVIGQVMQQIPHDEFLALSENDVIEQDARLITIRQQCVGTPKQKE